MSPQDLSSLGWEELDDLYREIILDHYRSPRNRDPVPDADIQAEGQNPFCGDEVRVQLKLEDGRIARVGVQGRGCSISQASASIMSDLLKGKSLEEALALSALFRRVMHGHPLSEEERERLGDLEALEGVRKYPIRVKCALLGWMTLEEGVASFQKDP